jgi:hypothetical protein
MRGLIVVIRAIPIGYAVIGHQGIDGVSRLSPDIISD